MGDIVNHELGVSFGYWVHPQRYMRHMKLALDSLRLRPNSRLVTLGIDGGLFEVFLAKHVLGANGRITAFVTDARNLRIAQRIARKEGVSNKINFEVFDAQKMQRLPANSYDAALSIATLHTLPQRLEIVSQFRRALRRNGNALLTYSVPYMQAKLGSSHATFKRVVEAHFDIQGEGFALTPRSALTLYGERERRLRRERGFGISQRYLQLRPK